MRKILSVCMLLLAAVISRADEKAAFGVNAPEVVSSEEMFKVTFVASGSGKVSGFTPPSFEGFEILAGPITGSSTSIQIINGKRSTSSEETFSYTLLPTGVGKFSIGSASVKIGGKTYRSGTVTVEVVKGETNAGQTGGGDTQQGGAGVGRDLLLSMSVSKTRVVKGEPIIATLKLYLQNSALSGFEDVKFPTFNGFWSQETEVPQQIEFKRENLDGRVYNSALLRKYMLIPQQTGDIVIDPAELVCLLQVRDNSPSRSIFDDFFDNYQTFRKRVVARPVTIHVSPLPAGAPASFKGGVGKFDMQVSLSVDSLKAHEAASLKVTVSGKGNINMVEAPAVVLPPDFEVYDVKKDDRISTTSNVSSGSRIFEYPFIPRSQGDFTIEPVQFTYYDVEARQYRTVSSRPLPIRVLPGAGGNATLVQGGVSGKQFVKSLGEDIRFIATSPARTAKEKPFLVVSVTLYALYLLVAVLFLLTAFLLRKNIVRRNDVAGTRNRKARKVAKARLKQAETFLKQNLYSAFYEELHKAVEGYISDKLMLPLADMSRDRISEALTAMGKEKYIGDLFSLLDACEYARYAPSSGSETMENHFRSAINILSEIESQQSHA